LKVFLSYASPDRHTAQRIQLALLGGGYQVFFDRASLPPGGDYQTRIRKAIKHSDLFVVLISPHFTAKRRYVHSEVEIAKAIWPKPWGHVLPILVNPTDLQSVDPYLVSATILEPSVDIAAEVAAIIDKMAPTTDDLLGEWSWISDDIEFIITFRSDGTFIATSEKGADRTGLLVHDFNGIWNIKDAHLEVTQTHYSILGLAREHPMKWIDSIVAHATKTEIRLTEIRLQDGTRLKRVASE
jgi:TIR domain